MIKKLISFLLICVFMFGAVSCGTRTYTNKVTSVDEKAEIEFYVWSEKALCEEVAVNFKKIYPNWTVNVVQATSDYYGSLQTYSGANIMPDVFYMQPGYISDFCRERLLLNLSPYLDKGENLTKNDLWDLNESYRYNNNTEKLGTGDYYAFIKDFTPEFMMIYNKSHIDEYNNDPKHTKTLAEEVGYPTDDGVYPSETKSMSWAQNEKMCYLLSKFDSNGNFTRYGSNVSFEPWSHLGEFVVQNGGRLYDENGYFNATNEATVKAVQHLANYMSGPMASSVRIGSATIQDGPGFKNGNISVLFSGRWAFQQFDWDKADFEIGVAPPAVPEVDMPLKAVSAMVGIAISAESKYPDVAYKFVEYYMTYGQKLLSKKGFNIPGNKTIANKDFIDTGDESIDKLNKFFLKFIDKVEMVEVNPWIDYGSTGGIFGLELTKAWASTSKLSIEKALANAKKSIDDKVDQNKRRYGI